MPTIRKTTLLLAFTAALIVLQLQATDATEVLTVGSNAPALDVQHWVQNGNGKFEPVTKFKSGKVYVVEFWATWCGPCVASMPHLASLQKEYADKGVQIVSISDEDLETVENFLTREVRGGSQADDEETDKAPQTYRDLTSAYCLTTDPDQSSYEDYMLAAEQNTIPAAFIVGKDAKIEWIGHPMELDEPLSAVVEDSWDREAFLKELERKQEDQKAVEQVFALLQKEQFDEAIEVLDARLAQGDNLQMNLLKLQILITTEKIDAATQHIQALYKGLEDKPETVNMLAWNLYEMAAQGRLEKGAIIDASMTALELAFKKADKTEKASILDTLAHLHFAMGDLDKAIEIETQAAGLSGDRDREFIETFLKELREVKKEESEQEADKP